MYFEYMKVNVIVITVPAYPFLTVDEDQKLSYPSTIWYNSGSWDS
jgi:hypothetical protein